MEGCVCNCSVDANADKVLKRLLIHPVVEMEVLMRLMIYPVWLCQNQIVMTLFMTLLSENTSTHRFDVVLLFFLLNIFVGNLKKLKTRFEIHERNEFSSKHCSGKLILKTTVTQGYFSKSQQETIRRSAIEAHFFGDDIVGLV